MFHPLTSRLIMIAGLFAALVLAGCGGGGDSGVENTLRADFEALEGELEDLQDNLKDATDRADAAEQARRVAEERERQARGDAADDIADAQQARDEAQRQTQTLEANQRAEKLLTTLKVAGTPPASASRVTISVPSKNKLTFTQADYRASTISAPGLRGAKLTRTRGGTQITAIYTDIELSRKLVEHYASTESMDNPGQFSLPGSLFTPVETDFVAKSKSTEPIDERVSLSHGLPSSVPKDATRAKETDPKASFRGTVHGVSGTFLCESSGTAACMLTATGMYNSDTDDSNPNRLQKVTLDVSGGTIYFKPSSPTASVSLCKDTAQCVAEDDLYMAFGWWWSEPVGTGAYEVEAFSGGKGLSANVVNNLTGAAEYNGTAVGMYVEQSDVGTAAVARKQGEFIADARLDATFDGAEVGIKGTIDSFKTTPTGGSGAPTTAGSWVVQLEGTRNNEDTGNNAKATLGDNGEARIERRGPDGTGTWLHRFLPARTGEPNQHPTAVVGTFESKVEDVLHLVGAFGAKR